MMLQSSSLTTTPWSSLLIVMEIRKVIYLVTMQQVILLPEKNDMNIYQGKEKNKYTESQGGQFGKKINFSFIVHFCLGKYSFSLDTFWTCIVCTYVHTLLNLEIGSVTFFYYELLVVMGEWFTHVVTHYLLCQPLWHTMNKILLGDRTEHREKLVGAFLKSISAKWMQTTRS